MLAVLIATVAFVTTALAQMPTSPWKKGAPVPEPDEELYGVPSNGKLYVFGGFSVRGRWSNSRRSDCTMGPLRSKTSARSHSWRKIGR